MPPFGRAVGHDVPPSEPEPLEEAELELDEPELEPPELELEELEFEGPPELDPGAPDPLPAPLELVGRTPPEPELEDGAPELEPMPGLGPAAASAVPPPAASSPSANGALVCEDPQAIVAKSARKETVHPVLLVARDIIRVGSGGQRQDPSRKPRACGNSPATVNKCLQGAGPGPWASDAARAIGYASRVGTGTRRLTFASTDRRGARPARLVLRCHALIRWQQGQVPRGHWWRSPWV